MNPNHRAGLADRLGRRIDYLRISVTDRCDLRCDYCLPRGSTGFCNRSAALSAAEFARLAALFARLGVSRIRLTGGEPLTRRDLGEIASRIGRIDGVTDLSLSTNATQLAAHAEALFAAGIRRLNVSLDSLDRQRFARITGLDRLPEVLQGLAVAASVGFAPIKLNMVVQTGVNDDEIDAMVEFCRARGFVLRLIERMPVGAAATIAFASLQGLRRRLANGHGLVEAVVPGGGPARYLRSPAGDITVGFITPMSQHFCASCNRLRLGADGALYTCLDAAGAEPIGARMRAGASDEELREAIVAAVWSRPAEHRFDRPRDRGRRPMATTGG